MYVYVFTTYVYTSLFASISTYVIHDYTYISAHTYIVWSIYNLQDLIAYVVHIYVDGHITYVCISNDNMYVYVRTYIRSTTYVRAYLSI